jgi:hypothetical protein
MQSIIQTEQECYITQSTLGLHKHHIFGGANRKKSEKYGLYVYLIGRLHNMSDAGVHFDKDFDLALKRHGQRAFEKVHGDRELFMHEFGRNYL